MLMFLYHAQQNTSNRCPNTLLFLAYTYYIFKALEDDMLRMGETRKEDFANINRDWVSRNC